jgi:hypothetical protein
MRMLVCFAVAVMFLAGCPSTPTLDELLPPRPRDGAGVLYVYYVSQFPPLDPDAHSQLAIQEVVDTYGTARHNAGTSVRIAYGIVNYSGVDLQMVVDCAWENSVEWTAAQYFGENDKVETHLVNNQSMTLARPIRSGERTVVEFVAPTDTAGNGMWKFEIKLIAEATAPPVRQWVVAGFHPD